MLNKKNSKNMEHEGKIYGAMVHRHFHDRDNDCGRRNWDRDDKWIEQNTADGVSALREAVPEVKNAIADKINAATTQSNANAHHISQLICDSEKSLMMGIRTNAEKILESKCDLEKSIGEVRFDLAKTESKLIERMDYESDQVKEKISNFERSTDKQFCEVKGEIKDSERRVLDKLCDMENERKNDLIAELRATSRNRDIEIAIERNNVAFSNQLQMINSQLIHLDNGLDNKITNKIVQIGAGLVAAPVATANNVK